MGNRWRHPICMACYRALFPGQDPFRLRAPVVETCCHCQKPTTAGIYARIDPEGMPCRGDHPDQPDAVELADG